ncbi:unnamed protein product [Hapterophycus canaliculatus]
MVPHADQRPAGKTPPVSTGGLKRKAPTGNGKGVASADPGRLQGKATEGRKPKPLRQEKCGAAAKNRPGTAEGETPGRDGQGKGKGKGKGKRKSDIDDIFAGVKRLKEQKAEEEAGRVAKKKKMKEEHKRRQANPFTGEGGPEKRWAWADEVKPVRFDDEGLPIYTWDSLRIGQGGNTALCPFDCDCCF